MHLTLARAAVSLAVVTVISFTAVHWVLCIYHPIWGGACIALRGEPTTPPLDSSRLEPALQAFPRHLTSLADDRYNRLSLDRW